VSGAAHHWDAVYSSKAAAELSWYQERAATSLRLLELASPQHGAVLDVGAGASYLVDGLLDSGWRDVSVLDVSHEALELVRSRLAARAAEVTFVVADLLEWQPDRVYDAWHDRAVLHFLTSREDQDWYARVAARAVAPGGALVVGVFAEDGPEQCSGLPTARYDAEALAAVLAPAFVLEHHEREEHVTPWGAVQPFTWGVLRRTEVRARRAPLAAGAQEAQLA
jgi:SAM-dependent methyltransferase